MSIELEIADVRIALRGFPAELVEEAVDGLAETLRRRLAGLASGDPLAGLNGTVAIDELSLGVAPGDDLNNANELRELIAGQLMDGLRRQLQGGYVAVTEVEQ